MLTHDNQTTEISVTSFHPISLEKRKYVFEFIIRQLEVIEEQIYLLEEETAGKMIFKAIQILEDKSRGPLSETQDEDEKNNDE